MNDHPGLAALAEKLRPTLLRAEQHLEVSERIAPLFPLGGPALGSSVAVEGSGATSLVMSILSTPTQMGTWVALVGIDQWGWPAAVAAGVDPRRTIAVAQPEPQQWSATMGALVGAFGILVVDSTQSISAADARRLDARCREHGAVVIRLSAAGTGRSWPSSADVSFSISNQQWSGVDSGYGHLSERTVTVRVGGRRKGGHRETALALPGPDGTVGLVDKTGERRLRRVV